MAAATILNFTKLSSFLYHWTKPYQIWWERCDFDIERNCHVKIRAFIRIQDLEFRKTVAISLLLDHTSPTLVGMLRIRCETHLSCRKIAQWSIFKLVAAAKFSFEKLLPIRYYSTNPHQIWWAWRHLGFRKIVVESRLFDQFSPNLVGLVWLRRGTYMSGQKTQSDWRSRWWLPSSCILKHCCRLLDIWPFLVKLSGNVINSIDNANIESKMWICTRIHDGFRHLGFW